MELASRLATQTRLEPSMAMPGGAVEASAGVAAGGETGLPVLSDSPMALFLLLMNQTLSEESMAKG